MPPLHAVPLRIDQTGEEAMSLKSTILDTDPTSYWPLDDAVDSDRIHDECGRHYGEPFGADLGEVPFGAARMPHFDGRLGKVITIPDDEQYSQDYSNALTVACWVAPSALDFRYTDGSTDQFVHFIEKARDYSHDVELIVLHISRPDGAGEAR
jgi:hypothetical protein